MAKPNIFGPVNRIASDSPGDGVERLAVGASQNIHKFDVVIFTAGLIEQAIALPGADATGSSPGSLSPYGIALEDITTDGTPDQDTDRINVVRFAAGSGRGLMTRIYNATAADAEQQGVLQNTVYRLGRWRITSTKWFYYVTTNTAQGDIRLLGFSPESLKGDNYGVVKIGL